MTEYEQIAPNCKLLWRENFEITDQKYTQVSGYVFNDQGELLIVRNDKTWTIPGGHPEIGETILETLNRELMEEACLTLKDINYLGAVEVVENGETYYQLRFTAKVDTLLDFNEEWEISERKFVPLNDLTTYIKWAKGIAFSAQIQSARDFWKI